MAQSEDRRKKQKAKKERAKTKKQAQRHEKRELLAMTQYVSEVVQSGKSRIAVGTVMKDNMMVVAMWETHGVDIHLVPLDNHASHLALAEKAHRHVGAEEWSTFLENHISLARTGNTSGGLPVAFIEWKPGEGPSAT